MSIYSFEPGPKYRPLTPQAAWDSALSSPLSLGTNFGEQLVGGALQSYVLGSTIRDTLIPQGNVERSPLQIIDALTPGIGMAKEAVRGLTQNFINPDQPSLSEDEWKASPSYRENIPYDPGMTAARADALAAWDDARKVREHFASKRPFSSFVGNLGGQALDPINYVPIMGPAIKAAAVARAGKIAGAALVASGDAAANTALAAAVTYDTRGSFGDEVSWQGTISEIATAALIGGAFGTIGGAIGARSDARAVREATDRLSTLRTTQEARIALNEAIDGIVSGEDIRLSPNATEPLARVQRELGDTQPRNLDAPLIATDNQSIDRALQTTGDTIATRINGQIFTGKSEQDVADKASRFFAATAAPTIERPEFKAWFGESKVVSDAGAPLVVYHGGKSDIDAFKPNDAGLIYMTSDPALASDYAQSRSSKGSVYPVYASVQNPLVVDRAVDHTSQKMLVARAKENGNDGIILKNADDSITGMPQRSNSTVVIAFEPSQIKSRFNTGTFSKSDPRIIDTSPARPDPIPEGRAKAEAALAKAETYKATAEQYRVDPETGSYVEEAEIKQLDIEGRLTEQDKADLEAAAQIHENAVAYGEALRAAAGCLI